MRVYGGTPAWTWRCCARVQLAWSSCWLLTACVAACGCVHLPPHVFITCRHRVCMQRRQESLRKQMYAAKLNAGSGHRLFLISRKTVAPLGSEAGPVEEFAVLGATGAASGPCTSLTAF